jgi:hypothetical protein
MIISEVGSCYRYNLGARDTPVMEPVRCGSRLQKMPSYLVIVDPDNLRRPIAVY